MTGRAPSRQEDLVLRVAAILASQAYEVQIEAAVAGLQLDVLAVRNQKRTAVECKAYSKLVGLRTARSFATTLQFLRETEEIHDGWLVTTQGFTQRARELADRAEFRISTISELQREFGIENRDLQTRMQDLVPTLARAAGDKKRIFVVMPYTSEMDDVFLLGIRWVANDLGVVAERADDLQHNGEIIDVIQTAIRKYDAILGDTSGANPNVCYEIGFAHALERPTVLICKRGTELPFDLRGVNHVMYRNVVHLREELPARIQTVLMP